MMVNFTMGYHRDIHYMSYFKLFLSVITIELKFISDINSRTGQCKGKFVFKNG